MPASNVEYWLSKIESNAKRDRDVTMNLKKRGWTVIRFWEHELRGGVSLSRKINMLKQKLLEHKLGQSKWQ